MEPYEVQLKFNTKQVNFFMNLNAMDSDALDNGKMYEPIMSGLFAEILNPGDMAIDVGANIGWFTVLSAALVGESGHVYSFEPAPENFESLKHHININNLNKVELVNAAVSDTSGTADLYLNPYGNGGHSFYNMQEGRSDLTQPTVIPVKKVTLDEYFETIDCSRLRLIKVDTEGHDVRVLAGAHKLLSKCRPPYVFTELHGGIKKFNDTQLNFMAMMRDYGYLTFLCLEGFPMPIMIPHGTQIRSKYAQNLLFSTSEDLAKLFPAMELSYEEVT